MYFCYLMPYIGIFYHISSKKIWNIHDWICLNTEFPTALLFVTNNFLTFMWLTWVLCFGVDIRYVFVRVLAAWIQNYRNENKVRINLNVPKRNIVSFNFNRNRYTRIILRGIQPYDNITYSKRFSRETFLLRMWN